MAASRIVVLSRRMAVWLSFAFLALSMSAIAQSQSQRFSGGTLSWTVSQNSQTYNRFTLNHLVYADFVFTYQGTAYPVAGSAAYVTCTSSYKGECASYPRTESAFFWLPSASEYVLFDPPIKNTELQAKGTKHPAQQKDKDVELGSVDNPSQF